MNATMNRREESAAPVDEMQQLAVQHQQSSSLNMHGVQSPVNPNIKHEMQHYFTFINSNDHLSNTHIEMSIRKPKQTAESYELS